MTRPAPFTPGINCCAISTWRKRSALAVASRERKPGRIAANASLPNRAMVSSGRMCALNSRQIERSAWSPTKVPKLSLNVAK